MSRPVRLMTALLMAAGLVSGCSSDSAAPVAAALEVSFATSATDDGAVLFTVAGGPVDSVEAPAGYRLYTAQTSATSMRVVVAGDLQPGIIARIHIADSRKLAQYSATIDQVAARGSYAQRDPVSYSIVVAE